MVEAGEEELEACVEEFRRVLSRAPRRLPLEPFEAYVVRWGSFKRELARVAASCLTRLLPRVKAVYYLELSGDDVAGRDVDLLIDIEAGQVFRREIADTAEALLEKLARSAGFSEARGLFEVHVAGEAGRLPGRLGMRLA